uniref:Laccase n=1 Tax=Sesuvium portulacastrum TaxID=221166 RepID=A0A2I7ZAW7_SESPO|nr:putative laccase [Sesuvium portulacastrum]
MARETLLFLAWGLALLASSLASASIVEHSFIVKNLTVEKFCERRVITAVNGSLPGPLLRVREGDTLIIHVCNESPYNVTLHWHGVFQKLSAWADGPEYITQCPIQPGNKYTYKFNITDQEGTLWWHSHTKWLRATVYGGLVIHPRKGNSYPFPKPHKEFPVLIGEWWNANPMDVISEALRTGGGPNSSDAYTINGQLGDLYPCSKDKTNKFEVVQGKTYLLRIINAALNNQFFFKVANHNMTVVAIDASYTVPYPTDVLILAPGQTVDVLMEASQPLGEYYMTATPYTNAAGVPFANTSTTAILVYKNTTSTSPILPPLPAFNDTPTAHKFSSNLTGLTSARFWVPPVLEVDEHMLMTVGLGLISCGKNATCLGPLNQSLAASISNFSFQLPTKRSILEAHFFNLSGIYNETFPDFPLMPFDYTNPNNSFNQSLLMTTKSTTVKRVKFNTTVEIVFQDTSLIGIENHPMHIHGFDFHVLAQGFGNYDPNVDRQKFNLVNPQKRNTIGVPVGGWAVIRIQFNNPGVWILHCHLDVHLSWGLAGVFVVDNGGTPSSTLPPPPEDLPKC